MEKQQQATQQPVLLKYKKEHTGCIYYTTGQNAVIQVYEEKASHAITKAMSEKPTLVFVLKGVLHFAFADADPKDIRGGEMFLLPEGYEFYGVAKTDSSVVICFVSPSMAWCNQLSLKYLLKYTKPTNATDTLFTVLPISGLLQQELEQTKDTLQTGLFCYHYQHIKRDTIFLLLRAFYTKDELTRLFYPILSNDFNFKAKIMQLYSNSQNVNELIERSGFPVTTFNRKFKAAFHCTPNQWLTQRKKENMRHEIRMTDLPLKKIAEDFNFTPNYLIKFCKDHFNRTPTELRGTHEE